MGNASSRIIRRGTRPIRANRKRLDTRDSKEVQEPRQENHGSGAVAEQGSFKETPGAQLKSRTTTPELPEGDMVNSLFGMISSRTETFVSETEVRRGVLWFFFIWGGWDDDV